MILIVVARLRRVHWTVGRGSPAVLRRGSATVAAGAPGP